MSEFTSWPAIARDSLSARQSTTVAAPCWERCLHMFTSFQKLIDDAALLRPSNEWDSWSTFGQSFFLERNKRVPRSVCVTNSIYWGGSHPNSPLPQTKQKEWPNTEYHDVVSWTFIVSYSFFQIHSKLPKYAQRERAEEERWEVPQWPMLAAPESPRPCHLGVFHP